MKRFCPVGLLILGAVLGAAEGAVAEVDYDHKPITCDFMRKHPAKVFSRPADLGAPISDWAQEDYRCAESLGQLPFLSRLARLAEVSHGEESRECNGTHIYSEQRQYLFDLLKAGLAPELFLREAARAEKRERGLYSHPLQYFAAWSQGSFSNFRSHREFLAESERALPKLAEHYQRNLHLSEAKAHAAARHALGLFVQRAAGDFSAEDLSAPVPPLVELAESPRGNLADLRAALAAQPAPGQDVIDQALKVALLHGKPRPYLSLLTAKLKTLDAGNESAVFFALGDIDNVRFLLERGASADRANGFGKTPLFYAIGLGDLRLVKLLLDHGADVNHPYKKEAELEPHPEAVGADCGAYRFIRHPRRTPLMHAAQHAGVPMLKLLLERGARLKDVDGMSLDALDYARMGRRPANVAFLAALGLHPREETR